MSLTEEAKPDLSLLAAIADKSGKTRWSGERKVYYAHVRAGWIAQVRESPVCHRMWLTAKGKAALAGQPQ